MDIKWLIVVLLSFLLLACSSSDENQFSHYIFTIKNRPMQPIEPLPEFKPLAKFLYPEIDNRRSPFKPRVVEQNDKLAPNAKRPRQPLEAFPLDALKFVGILEQGSTIWALIKEPAGLIVRAKPGDYMGQNYGQIIGINEKTIQLDESVQVTGKWEKKRITINLSVPD